MYVYVLACIRMYMYMKVCLYMYVYVYVYVYIRICEINSYVFTFSKNLFTYSIKYFDDSQSKNIVNFIF